MTNDNKTETRHEFVEGKTGMVGCWFPACGQPRNAAIHQVRQELGCARHGFKFNADCDACQTVEALAERKRLDPDAPDLIATPPSAAPEPSTTDGGETMSVLEIMQRFRNDGSCEQLIRDALTTVAVGHHDVWQPIEELEGNEGFWLVGHDKERWVCEAYWQSDEQRWYERNNDPTDSWGGAIFPTHGRPLPSPPVERKKKR